VACPVIAVTFHCLTVNANSGRGCPACRALWHDDFIAGTIGSSTGGVAGHFGRQVRRDRLAHGWSIAELARRAEINAAHLSRIENGTRPPTARIAAALDGVFTERRGWYLTWLEETRTAPEIPVTFREWSDYEDRTATLRVWTPGIVDGLVQAQDYAAALIATSPGVSGDTAAARLKARMERQRRVLGREKPPSVTLLVDESALYGQVGTAEIMAAQLGRLLEVAAMPGVVMQVMPEVAHASMASGYLIADDAVWCESVITGGTYTDPETVTATALRFDTLRAECYRASESLALIERLESQWATGVHRPTRRVTGASA
jgi:transcriptional regulator with XRE-family HTH domain